MRATNELGGNLKQLTMPALLEKFPSDLWPDIERVFNQPTVDGLVLFECIQLDSSSLGMRTVVVFGPGCSTRTLDGLAKKHLYDLPSQRQYPTAFVSKETRPQAQVATEEMSCPI
jgi:hypothetical protein